ncbi:MAG: ABC transporter substrate-binding protein [Desulfobacteraceae bacterium]|nr:ABC transporter substrate-binding protein [Desulfobacteraceae bacterium]MBC2754267.1 ABC transporter substrate-binding protein [Desulfobacteraceae bacterium]
MMKRFFLMFMSLCMLGLAVPVMADDVKTVESLLKEKTEAVLKILKENDKENDIDEQVKKNKIMEIVGPIIDFELMAKLTLGKTNWGKLSEKQKTEFVSLFVERLKRSYLDKSSFYDDEKIVYKPGFLKGNKVHVPVDIISDDKPIELLYKFYKSGRGWMAYDIEINGVSLIKSYQAQFTEVLKSGTAEDLLISLKKPVEN